MWSSPEKRFRSGGLFELPAERVVRRRSLPGVSVPRPDGSDPVDIEPICRAPERGGCVHRTDEDIGSRGQAESPTCGDDRRNRESLRYSGKKILRQRKVDSRGLPAAYRWRLTVAARELIISRQRRLVRLDAAPG